MEGGELEFERLPVGVEDQVHRESLRTEFNRERQAVGVVAPIRMVETDTVPGLRRSLDELVEAESLVFVLGGAQQAPGHEQLHEAMQVGVLLEQRPIGPAHLIILAVGIVVATLGAADFVAHHKHRHPQRQECDREKVLHLSIAQALDSRVVAGTFDAAVPAPAVVGAVAVLLAVGFVVFVVIGDEVVEARFIGSEATRLNVC